MLTGLHVLVVDDHDELRYYLTHVLETHQAVVTAVASGHEAIEAIQQRKPDVLISDINMPDMDGYELIRRVRALPPDAGGQIPAIALTSRAQTEDHRLAFAAGFHRHISKSVHPDELPGIISSLLSQLNRPKETTPTE